MAKKFTINLRERQMWCENDESLYCRYRFAKNKIKWINENKTWIDAYILKAIGQ